MTKTRKANQHIIDQILSRFNLTKLCPSCNGPLEIENSVKCVMCSMVAHIESNTKYIETGLHGINGAIGNKNVTVHRTAKPTAKKKTTTKKKTAKRKPATKRKPNK